MGRKECAGETLSLWGSVLNTFQTIASSLTPYWRMIGMNENKSEHVLTKVNSSKPIYFKDLPIVHKVFVLGLLLVTFFIMEGLI